LLQEAPEHRLFIEAPVVAEAIFVEVRLQIVAPDLMIDAADAALYEAPESLNRVV